jgi:putative ABC transport system substrate-binding protein
MASSAIPKRAGSRLERQRCASCGSIDILTASTSREIDAAFACIANEKRVHGLLVGDRSFFLAARGQRAILAARFAVPAIYSFREAAEAGGLLSYGSDFADQGRQAGRYVGRADMSVIQPTKFELVLAHAPGGSCGLCRDMVRPRLGLFGSVPRRARNMRCHEQVRRL